MSLERLREAIGRLSVSANALSAIGMALNAKAGGTIVAPEIRPHLDEVLAALGLADALDAATPAAIRPLLGEICYALHHGVARLDRDGQAPGWRHTGADILQSAGDVSAGFPALLQRMLPQLEGLSSRLDAEGARFLDVGVGVGVLSIEMARLWPRLRVVGIDLWAPSLAVARQNVYGAGLEARIELREQAVQDLADTDSFDLAWIPSAFIPGAAIPEAVKRVRRSLRAGGWLLFASVNRGNDQLPAALARLRTVEWGAVPWTPTEVERLLEQGGFTDVRTLPTPPASLVAFVAGRRQGA